MSNSTSAASASGARPAIPDKLYFKIGEVSRITGVEPYVLRYWESEFDFIQPVKLRNQRRYRRRDIERILEIRRLLYDERFTIAGAKKRLREIARETKPQLDLELADPGSRALVSSLRAELESIRKMLE